MPIKCEVWLDALLPNGEVVREDRLSSEARHGILELLKGVKQSCGQFRMSFEWWSEEDLTKGCEKSE